MRERGEIERTYEIVSDRDRWIVWVTDRHET